MKVRNLNLKKLAVIQFLIIGLLLTSVLYVWAQTGTTFTISQGIYPSTPSYTIWRENSNYYAKNAYGVIDYYGTNPSTLVESCLSILNDANGGLLFFKVALYTFTETIDIPFLSKSITFEGENGFGKVISETGASGTHFDFDYTDPGSLIQIDAHSDERSAYGINFKNIKFEGPGTTTSVALNLSNLDTGEISSCTFHQFGTSILCDFVGSSYPIGEQQGKLWIHNNEFAAGKTEYITLRKATQVHIHNNIFESWGPFERSLNIIDSYKCAISDNEFDINDESVMMHEHVRVETDYGLTHSEYEAKNIFLSGNWVWRKNSSEHIFIKTVGLGTRVFSKSNYIYTEFPFDVTESGPYNNTENEMQIWADDFHYPPAGEYRDETSTYSVNTEYANNWTACMIYFQVTMPAETDVFYVDVKRVGLGWATIVQENAATNTTDTRITVSVRIQTLLSWRYRVSGSTAMQAIYVVYN